MNRAQLKQIEADVVFVAVNQTADTVHIQPIWECEIPPADLWKHAARFGLECVEHDGEGQVRVEIYDFRVEE